VEKIGKRYNIITTRIDRMDKHDLCLVEVVEGMNMSDHDVYLDNFSGQPNHLHQTLIYLLLILIINISEELWINGL